jgi:outer membrane protein OmpA-like peptidoglycan-associated protein
MKKGYILSLSLLVVLSGCKKKTKAQCPAGKSDVRTEVDIPVANDGIKSFFDGDLDEFALSDDAAVKRDMSTAVNANIDAQGNEYSWINETDGSGFKKVYFDFDKYDIRQDQQTNLAFDIDAVKKQISDAQATGAQLPIIVIDGHACHSAGSRVYNLALSERRAKVLADKLVEAGIPQECLKIVGRGSEVPALINGRVVEGGREEQAPNRRDEIHLVHA